MDSAWCDHSYLEGLHLVLVPFRSAKTPIALAISLPVRDGSFSITWILIWWPISAYIVSQYSFHRSVMSPLLATSVPSEDRIAWYFILRGRVNRFTGWNKCMVFPFRLYFFLPSRYLFTCSSLSFQMAFYTFIFSSLYLWGFSLFAFCFSWLNFSISAVK